MKIIANINGWKKEIDIPFYLFHKGVCHVPLEPPLTTLVHKADLIPVNEGINEVCLIRVSDNEFKYLPNVIKSED